MVAIAMIGDPKVLFLDEPTAGMDSGARRDLWAVLLKKRKGRCIVLCTHHMDEADILGDRVAVIHKGKLQESGSSSALKAKYSKGLHLFVSMEARSKQGHKVFGLLEQASGKGTVTVDVGDIIGAEAGEEAVRATREKM